MPKVKTKNKKSPAKKSQAGKKKKVSAKKSVRKKVATKKFVAVKNNPVPRFSNPLKNNRSFLEGLFSETKAPQKSAPEIKETKAVKEIQEVKEIRKIRPRNPRLSPYVLDLKKIQAERASQKQIQNKQAYQIGQELFKKIPQPKFLKNIKKQKAVPIRLTTIKADRPQKSALPKARTSRLALPKLPRFKMPAIDFPEVKLPTLKFPQLHLPNIQPLEIRLGSFMLPNSWGKKILSFMIFAFIFILPFSLYNHYQQLQGKKESVLEKTAQALFHLTLSEKTASAQDFYYTQLELSKASDNFRQAKEELDNINLLTQTLIKLYPPINKQFVTAQKLISIGEKLSASGAVLTQTVDQLNLTDSPEKLNLSNKLIILKDKLNLILPDIKSANQDLQGIYLEEIPAEYHDKIKTLQTALPLMEKNIEKFISYSDVMANLLGNDYKKRYLFLFQNNHELRPTGGFIGSFALVDIDQGNIEKINIPGGGPYDLQGSLKASIGAPRPLRIMNERWEFQDANWFANLPTSAEKLIWFYEKSGGPTVDGIVFINATFLENILEITGPIELADHGKTITKENFFDEIQKSVELDYDKAENRPKQIIADLTPIVISKLLNSDQKQFTEILDKVLNALEEKEIQFYFTDYSVEKVALQNNWGGLLKETDRDYLDIVSTNIAGEKTDAKIKQTADLQVNIEPNGTITNTLTITKTHTGQPGEAFYGVPNLDYLRIYVPRDSQLIKASGFDVLDEELFTVLHPEYYQKDPDLALIEAKAETEVQSKTDIFQENNKTVFANWMKVEPGQTKTVTISYQLPFKLDLTPRLEENDYLTKLIAEFDNGTLDTAERYSLLWQKQSGKTNFDIKATINFPKPYVYQLTYPEKLISTGKSFTFTDSLNTDKLLGIIFQP